MISNQTPIYEPFTARFTGTLTVLVMGNGERCVLMKPYLRVTKHQAYMIKRHGDKVRLLPLLMPEEATCANQR